MNVSTVVKQKYFNDVASAKETQKYLRLVIDNFQEVGMVAFGQIKFIAQNKPGGTIDYNWESIDNLVDFATKNNLRLRSV